MHNLCSIGIITTILIRAIFICLIVASFTTIIALVVVVVWIWHPYTGGRRSSPRIRFHFHYHKYCSIILIQCCRSVAGNNIWQQMRIILIMAMIWYNWHQYYYYCIIIISFCTDRAKISQRYRHHIPDEKHNITTMQTLLFAFSSWFVCNSVFEYR